MLVQEVVILLVDKYQFLMCALMCVSPTVYEQHFVYIMQCR